MALQGNSTNITFDAYKKQHIKIAKDLQYGNECYEQIEKAKTVYEISHIMSRYRHRNDD